MNTLTIDIKVPTTVDTVVINLPYYCADKHTKYAIITEKKIISLNDWKAIEQCNIWLQDSLPMSFKYGETVPITREEFLECYNQIMSRITDLL